MNLQNYLAGQTDDISGCFLTKTDPSPFQVFNAFSKTAYVITIDHASCAIPAVLGDLGVSEKDLKRHIAYDIGALEIGKYLSKSLDSVAIASGFSRLVVDVNRFPNDPTAFLEVSDNVVIPGNANLTDTDRQQRLHSIFWPYHVEIWRQINQRRYHTQKIAYLNIHTCTDQMNGQFRPWEIGVLWDRDQSISAPLIEVLRKQTDLCIGDNKPYSGASPKGYSVATHAEFFQFPHVTIEVRQDLVQTSKGIARFSDILTKAFQAILPNLDL